MIQVELPTHLATLARTGRDVAVEPTVATFAAVIDELERRFPGLLGTIRDPVTAERRPFIRFFACEEDLSHHPMSSPLPDPVARGHEPLLIIAAIAGG